MIRSFRAELARLSRRRVLPYAVLAALVFAIGGAALTLSAAGPAADRSPDGGMSPTLESLSAAGGGTEIFRSAAAFAGTMVFAVFVGMFALEFSRGTYRTMLLRQPLRVRLLLGRLGALLAFCAVFLACVEVVMWIAARFMASGYDVSTDRWTSLDALGSALSDYASVLAWVTGYAVFAMTVGVLLRSVPLALGFGIAWAGPFEHLMADAWSAGREVFPGLLLEVLGQGGTDEVSATRAVLTLSGYVAVAAAASCAVFARRDVTA